MGLRKTVHCEVTEPITGIHHELVFAAYDELPYLETTIVLTNRSDSAQSFSHWTTTVLAPGGKGEVTPMTELILPADRFRPDDRDFNDWMLNLEMASDITNAAESDHIDDTLDYRAVSKRVTAYVQESKFQLIETMVERVAQLIRDEFGVAWLRVTVHKPGAVRGSRDVGISIERGAR